LQARSRKLAAIVRQLRLSEEKGRLAISVRHLLPHYIHMHVNRMLRNAHRPQELVLYHLLTRLYESQVKSVRPAAAKVNLTLSLSARLSGLTGSRAA
jgi:hypothetical protein